MGWSGFLGCGDSGLVLGAEVFGDGDAGFAEFFDEGHAQGNEALLDELFFFTAEIAARFVGEHFELIDEHLGGLEIFDGLAGLGVRNFAQEHQRHVGVLNDHVREKRGHELLWRHVFSGHRPLISLGLIVHVFELLFPALNLSDQKVN